jgi:hypothetical protein
MKRKPVTTVRLTDRQLAYLKAEAERLDISVGDLIRRIIDQHIEGEPQ